MAIEQSSGTSFDSSPSVAEGATPSSTKADSSFRYLDDPICLCSMLLYLLNRFLLKPYHVGGWLVHDYLNDFLCLPIFVPIILRFQSAMGVRRRSRPPTAFEIIHNWLVFSVLYFAVLPRMPAFSSTADPWNSVAYACGGLLAWAGWQKFYSRKTAL